MSLFQVKEWWETRCGVNEEFDYNHLIVDNIDNEPTPSDKIVTASIDGTVRIYLPNESEYKIEHLILEKKFDDAILQIEFGRFSSYVCVNYVC